MMLRFAQTLALIIFCFAIGEVAAVFVTGLLFGVSTDIVFQFLNDPKKADRDLLLTLSFLSAIFRFLLVPGIYLYFTDRRSLQFLQPVRPVRLADAFLVILLFVSALPCVSLLIDLNLNLSLPGWPSGVETYFRESETRAHRLTGIALSFEGSNDLMITMLVVAIVPGIAEEIFFRGIVQERLHNVVSNAHYAVLVSAALFSLFHFQFYGFLPRMALGMLLGYVYLWTTNIWYPVLLHAANNVLGIAGALILEPKVNSMWGWILLLPSIAVAVLITRQLKKLSSL